MSIMRRRDIFSMGVTPIERRASRLLFLIGLGSSTQIHIGGYTAISEFVLVLLLPLNLLKNQTLFRRDGLMPLIGLLIFWMVGVCISDFSRGFWLATWIRGMIPAVGILASIVALYPLLAKHPEGFRWMLLGSAISGVISIFVFQHGSDIGSEAVQSGQMTATEAVIGYKLFWVAKINEWVGLPVKGWYLQTPHMMSVLIGIFLAVFGLYSGGRSSFLSGMLTVAFLYFGGHSAKKMSWIKKNVVVMLVILVCLLPAFKYAYKVAATSGWMGEKELDKYEEQTQGGHASLLQLVMAGRSEFFVGVMAALDHPWLGHGSCALDTRGYRLEFLAKYGDPEDYKQASMFAALGIRQIPAHSHIVLAWLWAGIPGLLPWIYIMYLLVSTLLRRMHIYPPFFGYFSFALIGYFWAILFSPLGNRIYVGLMISMCLLVKAMARRQCMGLMPYGGGRC